jgi:hypothetical protein
MSAVLAPPLDRRSSAHQPGAELAHADDPQMTAPLR